MKKNLKKKFIILLTALLCVQSIEGTTSLSAKERGWMSDFWDGLWEHVEEELGWKEEEKKPKEDSTQKEEEPEGEEVENEEDTETDSEVENSETETEEVEPEGETEEENDVETEIEEEEPNQEVEKTPQDSLDEDMMLQPENNEKVVMEQIDLLEDATVQLKSGSVFIKQDMSEGKIEHLLYETLVVNQDVIDESTLQWEYRCEGKPIVGSWGNESWGSVHGFTTTKGGLVKIEYTHPALKDNADGDYQVRIAGTDQEVTLTKLPRLDSDIQVKENIQVVLSADENGNVDFDKLYEAIFEEAIVSSTPELSLEDVEIQYYATMEDLLGISHHAWVSLEGGKDGIYEYPPIGEGGYEVRIVFAENTEYKGTTVSFEAEIMQRPEAEIELNENIQVILPADENGNADFDKLRQRIFEEAVVSSTPELSLEDVEIRYYTEAVSGSLGEIGKAWMPLEGGNKDLLTYPAIGLGTHKIRINYNGNSEYKGTMVEFEVTIQQRPEVQFELKEGPYQVNLLLNEEGSQIDFDGLKRMVFEAVILNNDADVNYADLEYQYEAKGILSTKYVPFEGKETYPEIGLGTQKVKLIYDGDSEHSRTEINVEIEFIDQRIATEIVFKDGVSLTYHPDYELMKREIFNYLIDWDNSLLPEGITYEDLTFKYYAPKYDLISEGALGKPLGYEWKGFEGEKKLFYYPAISVGSQDIRISYQGNREYRPVTSDKQGVNVEKAKVQVRVQFTNKYADEKLGDDFVTIVNSNEKFNIYTIYAGITSNITGSLYLELPEGFTDNTLVKILKPLINPILEATIKMDFDEMLQRGITVGDLRQLIMSEDFLNLINGGLDFTGVLGDLFNSEDVNKVVDMLKTLIQVVKELDRLPNLLDSVRIAFAQPDHAGLYTVIAIADNPNYEVGVGIGELLVKMRMSGVKFVAKEDFGKKITQEQAKEYAEKGLFEYQLFCDGVDVTQDDKAKIHYLYSGMTKKWKVYSSTTTPPSEAGSYIQTVVTIGGNYQAAPVTRTFEITK